MLANKTLCFAAVVLSFAVLLTTGSCKDDTPSAVLPSDTVQPTVTVSNVLSDAPTATATKVLVSALPVEAHRTAPLTVPPTSEPTATELPNPTPSQAATPHPTPITVVAEKDNKTSAEPGDEPDAFISISAGPFHTCALRADGRAVCWGDNSNGQSSPPNYKFTMIDAGSDHNCGIKFDDSVAC